MKVAGEEHPRRELVVPPPNGRVVGRPCGLKFSQERLT
jgi:hypothetical protein